MTGHAGYAGVVQLLSEGGGGECDCGITDSFNRVETAGWGTSDSGLVYTYAGINNAPAGSGNAAYIDGQYAAWRWEFGGPNCILSTALPDEFTVYARFRTGDWDYNGSDGYANIEWGTNARAINITPGSNNGFPDPHGSIDDEDTVLSFDFHPLSWYYLKWHYRLSDGLSELKVWAEADPEPDWLLSSALGSGDDPPTFFRIRGTSLNNWSSVDPYIALFDFIDISGVNRCSQYIFDDFNRTGTAGWGTSDWGVPWPNIFGTPTVTSGVGRLQSGVSPLSSLCSAATLPNAITMVTSDDRTIRGRIRMPSSVAGNSGNPNNYQTLFRVEDTPNGAYAELVVRTNGPNAGPLINMESGWGVQSVPVSLQASRWYDFVFETNYASGHWAFKVWEVGLAEPGWLVEDTNTPYAVGAPGLELETFWDGAGSRIAEVEYIDFTWADKGCYRDCDAVVDTFTRTEAAGLGTADFGVAYSYIGGTTGLSVDGDEALFVSPSSVAMLDLVLGLTLPVELLFKHRLVWFGNLATDPQPGVHVHRDNSDAFTGGAFTGASFGVDSGGLRTNIIRRNPVLGGPAILANTALAGYTSGQAVWTRLRCESTATRVKTWFDGQPEPASFTSATQGINSTFGTPTTFGVEAIMLASQAGGVAAGSEWYVDYFEIVEGYPKSCEEIAGGGDPVPITVIAGYGARA